MTHKKPSDFSDDPHAPTASAESGFSFRPSIGLSDGRALASSLVRFARSPIAFMRRGPVFTWPASVVLQAAASIAAGSVHGWLAGSWISVAIGVAAFPFVAIAASASIALFLRAGLAAFADARPNRRALYSLVAQATLPYLLLHSFASYLPPVDLLGFLLTCMLLAVGLAERFRAPRRIVIRLSAFAFALFFAAWAWTQARSRHALSPRPEYDSPRSLDDLERDLRKNSPSSEQPEKRPAGPEERDRAPGAKETSP